MTNRMSFEPMLDFRAWLIDAMAERRITVKALEKMSGISESSIIGYRGGTHEPTLFAVYCITNALGYTLGVVPTSRRYNANK